MLGVKRKDLKRKKDRTLNGPVENEVAAEHGTAEGINIFFSLAMYSQFYLNRVV